MAVLRYRVKHYVAVDKPGTEFHLHRDDFLGEAASFEFAVTTVPHSQQTPVKITLDAAALETHNPASRRLECELYLSRDDALKLAALLGNLPTTEGVAPSHDSTGAA